MFVAAKFTSINGSITISNLYRWLYLCSSLYLQYPRHILNVSSLQSLNICLLKLLLILLLADLENWKENCFINLSILLLPTYTCLCITLARMAANCSCVGQPMTVYWSRLYSGLAGLPPIVFAALDIDCNQADRAPWNRIFEEKYFINILYRVPEKSW